jgi:hypothetical protein
VVLVARVTEEMAVEGVVIMMAPRGHYLMVAPVDQIMVVEGVVVLDIMAAVVVKQ